VSRAGTARRVRATGIIAVLALATSTLGYGAFALLAPLPPITPVVLPLAQVSTPEPAVVLPTYGASAIAAADGEQIYAGRDLDTPRPIASIAKVVTALVVLAERPIEGDGPGASITLSAADSRLPARYAAINGTVAPAPAGAVVTQRQMIELMMVHSANNYAESLAVWGFGSVDAYLAAARRWLDGQGLASIRIADTTGFSPDNRATPRDLVALARLAAADPVVAAASARRTLTVPGIGTFENRNLALGTAGITGLKTGTLRVVGSNLLFSGTVTAADEPVDIVGVVIGAPDQETIARDLRRLIASVVDDYHAVAIGEPGAVVARYTAPWGDTAELVVDETITDLVWGDVRSVAFTSAPEVLPGLGTPSAPTLIVRYGDREARLDLRWVGEIGEPPLAWRLAQPLAEVTGD
jgi:D-alanyl-D-alanine carboxypeptidase (penicillin-binding protein 5/6)